MFMCVRSTENEIKREKIITVSSKENSRRITEVSTLLSRRSSSQRNVKKQNKAKSFRVTSASAEGMKMLVNSCSSKEDRIGCK